ISKCRCAPPEQGCASWRFRSTTVGGAAAIRRWRELSAERCAPARASSRHLPALRARRAGGGADTIVSASFRTCDDQSAIKWASLNVILLHAVLSAAAARGIGQILHVRFQPPAGEGEHELARPGLTVAAGLGERVLGGAGDGEGLHEA